MRDGSWNKGRSFLLALCAVVVLRTVAFAQDYTVTTTSGLLESRPAGAIEHDASQNAFNFVDRQENVSLPFEFPYYGARTTEVTVSCGGFIVPRRDVSGIDNPGTPTSPHGQDTSSDAFPYTQSGKGGAGTHNVDGIIAALFTNVRVNDASSSGKIYTWISGAEPARRFVASWENVNVSLSGSTPITFQIHLHEGTGRIDFAYSTSGTWPGPLTAGFVLGIDSPIDSRYVAPLGSSNTLTGHPGSDFTFVPRSASYSGTALYERIVSDASGVGSTTTTTPLSGCAIELRRASDGHPYASAISAADGTFSLTTVGAPTATPGELVALSRNGAVLVASSAGGSPAAWTMNGSVSFAAGASFGTSTLGAGADATGDLRAALHVASVCERVRAFASQHTSESIPRLDVTLDPSSSAASLYVAPAAVAPAALRIASRGASNPDAWDSALVARCFGRHVLASIAGAPLAADHRFDAETSPENAFAEGFGYALWAAVSGASEAIDGLGSSSALVHDLEAPALSVARSASVAGAMAGALYDLVDAANETIDRVDGTAAPGRIVTAAGALSVAPNAGTFAQAWFDLGYDGASLVRVFVAHGALPDDAAEPNDDADEAILVGAAGTKRAARTLNRFNEDWYAFTLAQATPSLIADVLFDSVSISADVALEVRDTTGALLATGTRAGASAPLRASAGPLAAGTYRVGVRQLGGATVPAYVVQAYVPLSIADAPLRDWTVDRPYDTALGVRDGVAPYVASTVSSTLPPGLGFSQASQRVVGAPSTVGSFAVTLRVTDDGEPANVVSRTQTVRINDVLTLPIAPFVGFPVDRAVAASLPTRGGTAPFALTMPTGSLPAGLSFAPGSFDVTGAASAQPSVALELDAQDVAGSADRIAVRAVVAPALDAKNVPAALVAGEDACGWWFDAVKGSVVTFSAKTAKKQPKRLLAGMVLAPDRSQVTDAAVKGKNGSLSAKLACPASGRYFVVASSDAGEATQLLGNVRVAPPKSGKAKIASFLPTETVTIEVGAIAGASFTLKFAGDKKRQLTAKVVGLVDPNGASLPFGGVVTPSAVGGTLAMTLSTGGTWTVVLGAQSTSGEPGKLTYAYSVKNAKGAVYAAD